MNSLFNNDRLDYIVKRCGETGKVIHQSRIEAIEALAKLKHASHRKDETGKRIKHRGLKPGGKRIYYCFFCGGYHLTSWSWWPFGTKNYLTRQQQKIKYETMFTI
ncbi:hypothetical protein [Niabella sp.]|uniref:hypothetical protein n=1 Tax=Niabella sp. TaxID=1962976 RepID=UPI0026127F4A|nr:hypothetical protein [Niabella sp.]